MRKDYIKINKYDYYIFMLIICLQVLMLYDDYPKFQMFFLGVITSFFFDRLVYEIRITWRDMNATKKPRI